MPKAMFTKGTIKAVFCAIPETVKCIDDEVDMYGGDSKQIERIKKTIGINKRHVVSKNTTAADLCAFSAEQLIKELEINTSDIDAVILVTQTPDYFQPFSAAVIHKKLELSTNCAAFDVNLGCSGYVYGLWLAFMMIESNSCTNVLVLAGDTLSKCVSSRDRAVAPLFGDAGTATLVTKSETSNPTYFSLHTDGEGYEHIIIPAGAFRRPRDESTSKQKLYDDGNTRSLENLYMNGAEVFNFSIKVEPSAIKEIFEYSGETEDSIDYIFFHQANKYIISNITRRLNFPLEKVPCETVGKYGNQSSASIPVTICDTIGEEIVSSSRKVVMSGFGVGLSWATCLTTLQNANCPNVFIYKEEQV